MAQKILEVKSCAEFQNKNKKKLKFKDSGKCQEIKNSGKIVCQNSKIKKKQRNFRPKKKNLYIWGKFEKLAHRIHKKMRENFKI